MLDAHHHLWAYNEKEYGWIPEGSPLAQDQLIPELESVTKEAGVKGTVAVQARQETAESDALLAMSYQSPVIRGVVGWVPLIDEGVGEHLERYAQHKAFVGVRHVLQDEPDEYFLRDDFHRGLAMLPGHNLRYDLLLFQRQLPVATQLVDRQPNLPIIVDHIAKPEAKNGQVEDGWRQGMKELAKRDNVQMVKFSGLVTEFADPAAVDPRTLESYFSETLEIFGADRVCFGTDWPVCLLRTSYLDWAETVRELASRLSEDEEKAVLQTNAERFYGLSPAE